MLRILTDQGKRLHGVSCGILADEYREIINERGRESFGAPYLACFKTCISTIAKEMENFPAEDQFAVAMDRNDQEMDAVRLFYDLKDDPGFKFRHRLAGCAPFASGELVILQPADFIAYESFRLLHSKRYGNEQIRVVLKSMFNTNGFTGYYFGTDQFREFKEPMETSTCRPNGFFINMPSVEEALQRAKRAGTQ
jgi:hypothetical protein